MNKSLSVIVPCFNEEEVINETYKRLKAVLTTLDLKTEIIFINDGSSDNTEHLLNELTLTDKNIKIISFSRNFGHQKAVTAGLNHCASDMAVIIDADLQDPPEVIPEMIKTLIEQTVKCLGR